MVRIDLSHFGLKLGSRAIFDNLTANFTWNGGGVGGTIGLMGPSGSGKTTLLRQILVARYVEPVPGIAISPRDVAVGFVPQAPILFNNMDVLANARMFETVGRYKERFDRDLFAQLVDVLRLGPVLRGRTDPQHLSGGEAQRLMLLRTLSVRPDLLLLDEPATGLDAAVRDSFLVDVAELIDRLSIATIYIGHHWEEVSFLADRIAYLVLTSAKRSVCAMPVVDQVTFRATPPTPDAFEAVYGPGCGAWPIVVDNGTYRLLSASDAVHGTRAWLACFPPSPGLHRPRRFVRVGSYRLERALAADPHDVSAAAPAWIYHNGEFLERSSVSTASIK
jgi:ABC-type nitrate/sulfonate/bicarbonate transport system ATPase subunit